MVEIRAGLRVDPRLADFFEVEVTPGTRFDAPFVWEALADLVREFGPRNRELLAERDRLQEAIDAWHLERSGAVVDLREDRDFLQGIGYLVEEGPVEEIRTDGVDAEVALVAGPQLVVPVSNARYALNAANARWGSLYDALYGTDALGDLPTGDGYDPARGQRVIAWSRQFLDDVVPLSAGSHADAVALSIDEGRLCVALSDGTVSGLIDPDCFLGYTGDTGQPSSIWLRHHGLAIEIVIDPSTVVGRSDRAGISDVRLESAVTTIIDFEDSVSTVDAEDKVGSYRNWLGLMRGDLEEEVAKSGTTFTRRLNPDFTITSPSGATVALPGRSLLMVRNVGIHMMTNAVLDDDGNPIPEGILDALLTVLIACRDLDRTGTAINSRAGSVYVVKPKLHGPAEVAFAVDVFTRVEDLLGLPRNTIKIGIMDEERRTSLTLAECIRVAKDRVCFINTGFLDRTGDEIRTSTHAGPMVRKPDMKSQGWISSYENRNVDVGLAAGFKGRAQIGKGMWAAPDRMADMLRDKAAHPLAGASCAWVPSPTAATLHATHYHRIDVAEQQERIAAEGARAEVVDLLRVPVAQDPSWSADEVQSELDNNLQGLLGYVVRWVNAGVGCSKVPDINSVGLMEDRATLRISSQHVANWLRHGVVSGEQVDETLRRMADVVDAQNSEDPDYEPMGPAYDGPAFLAARELVTDGIAQPNGYTEPLLHAYRLQVKAQAAKTN
jgi:malate synthase